MQLFLVRHGNTFGPDQQGGQRVFMSGCDNNIPLVQSGREQAFAMANYLATQDLTPTTLYANHLLRTWEHASIIRDYFYLKQNQLIPLMLDENLMELDYGAWAGLGSVGNTAEMNEVIAQFGQEAWDDWQKRRIILNHPPHCWRITEKELLCGIEKFFKKLAENHSPSDVIVAMGSQGSISFVNALFEGGMTEAIKRDAYKINTGHFCHLIYHNGKWSIEAWNQAPNGK